jgi:hypothetical protein
MQAGHTDAAVSLPAVACACGIEQALDITNEQALREFSTLMHSARGDALWVCRSPQTARRACCRHGTEPCSRPAFRRATGVETRF